jgi:release factor glutamine methyltransferase
MNKSKLFDKLINDLRSKLHLLEDKPEETVETTLKALWLTASGMHISAEHAADLPLPDLTEKQADLLSLFIELRLNNKPLAHITGRQNFMGIELLSDNRALIPRKETEILGRKAVEIANRIAYTKGKVKVIDVCCGSGNLGIAVAYNNKISQVSSADISKEAVDLTQGNIDFLKLKRRINVRQSDLLTGFESNVFYTNTDLIICNPPYIQSSKVKKMDTEIASNEPELAFDGGMLGIKIIQKLIHEAPRFLINGGWLAFEVGVGQGQMISQLCEKTRLFSQIETVLDNSNNIRAILAQK